MSATQKPILFEAGPETFPVQYSELLVQNPFLARAEGEARTKGWTDLEIRTFQLLAACASNASLLADNNLLKAKLMEKLKVS